MLNAWSGGDQSALEQLTPMVYAELHRLAGRNMARERDGHLLQPSALVNEAFLRLLGGVSNLTDRRYEEVDGYPAPRLRFAGGLEARF